MSMLLKCLPFLLGLGGAVAPRPRREPPPLEAGVAANQRYYESLLARDADSILDALLAASRTPDGVKTGLAARALSQVLQRPAGESAAFYARVQDLLSGSGLDADARAVLASMLGRTATEPALRVLLTVQERNAAGNLLSPRTLAHALAQAGDQRWGDRFHPELAPVLQVFWRAGQDRGVRQAAATALAKVGDPDGVRALLREVMDRGATRTEAARTRDERVMMAVEALDQVRNPALVELLAAGLSHRDPDGTESALCARALASLGDPRATGVLLAWMREAGDAFVPLVQEVLARIPDAASQERLARGLESTFRSTRVRQALAAAVDGRPRPQQP